MAQVFVASDARETVGPLSRRVSVSSAVAWTKTASKDHKPFGTILMGWLPEVGTLRSAIAEPMPQVFRHVSGCDVAIRRSFCQSLETDAFQFPRDRVVDLPGRTNQGIADLLQQFGCRFPLERQSPRQHSVKDDTQAENIAAAIDTMSFAMSLFGTHVGCRTGAARPLTNILRSESQPKISNEWLSIPVEQDVARLDVPMHHQLWRNVCMDLALGSSNKLSLFESLMTQHGSFFQR